MKTLELSPGNTLVYDYQAPRSPQGVTFVFFNALTGNAGMWGGAIGSALREAGHGMLVYNMRGQVDTAFSPGLALDMTLVVDDAVRLIGEVQPQRPLYVGLSIGGLFAARAHLAGAPALGMALINTLRRDGPRLQWVNAAVARAAEIGGPALIMDMYAPLLFAEPWLAANRATALNSDGYVPIDRASGAYSLLASAGAADWDVPWERIDVPVLVLTGKQDHVFYDEADVAALAARMPGARRVDLDDAGHLIPVERPDALVRELLALAGRCAAS